MKKAKNMSPLPTAEYQAAMKAAEIRRLSLEGVTIDVQTIPSPGAPNPDAEAIVDVWIHDANGRLIGSAQEIVESWDDPEERADAALARAFREAVKAAA